MQRAEILARNLKLSKDEFICPSFKICLDIYMNLAKRKSDIKFSNENELEILLKEKFKSERGRINCSLWAEKNRWRWLGIQYVIAEY